MFVCVEVLRPSEPTGSCLARSVNLTTLLLAGLEKCQKLTTALLEGENDGRN